MMNQPQKKANPGREFAKHLDLCALRQDRDEQMGSKSRKTGKENSGNQFGGSGHRKPRTEIRVV
jgi:hypothetical protein